MKILSNTQIREADSYTIKNEPITSLGLMERAAKAFVEKFITKVDKLKPVYVFCGPGNNGGDGLVIARLLVDKGYSVRTYIAGDEKKFSADNIENKRLLEKHLKYKINSIKKRSDFPKISPEGIVIDALFGSGLSRPIDGLFADIIGHINDSGAKVFSVDLPSGLFSDNQNSNADSIIKADYTYTFQLPKLSFFLCENSKFTGEWSILDIKLSSTYISKAKTSHFFIDADYAASLLKMRHRCDHKGTFGHALLIAGSYGKMGAAVLAARACLRSGVGLLTVVIPRKGIEIMQTAVPEAMVNISQDEEIVSTIPDLEAFRSIGIGPGIGKDKSTVKLVRQLFRKSKVPMVIDADALNIIASLDDKPNLEGHILTPHPKEFERLAGTSSNEWEMLEKASQFAKDHGCVLVLKKGYTSIHLPDGAVWFNATGNPGMATGGTGDALTGLITGLLAQGYLPTEAAILGVFLHGFAGNIAADNQSQESMLASDLINSLGNTFKFLYSIPN